MVNGGVETFNPFTVVIPFISLIELNVVNRLPSISRMIPLKRFNSLTKRVSKSGDIPVIGIPNATLSAEGRTLIDNTRSFNICHTRLPIKLVHCFG